MRHRLCEGRAHSSPTTASAVLTVRDEIVSDLPDRVMEEYTATRTERHEGSVHVGGRFLSLLWEVGGSVLIQIP